MLSILLLHGQHLRISLVCDNGNTYQDYGNPSYDSTVSSSVAVHFSEVILLIRMALSLSSQCRHRCCTMQIFRTSLKTGNFFFLCSHSSSLRLHNKISDFMQPFTLNDYCCQSSVQKFLDLQSTLSFKSSAMQSVGSLKQ